MKRAIGLFGCGLLLLSQSGCATLFTATICAATGSHNCGEAVETALIVDAAVIEAAAHADAYSYEEREPSYCAPADDPDCDAAPDGCCAD